jgi:hypothetical protein
MIFTESGVSSLAVSLEHWEWAEYASCALVALGCTGEYIAEFTDCLTDGLKEKKDRLAKRSTLLLISALALELVCLVKTNSISGRLIGSLGDKAGAAEVKAQSALDKSSLAEHKAEVATTTASTAETAARKAQDKGDGLTLRMESASRQLGRLEDRIAAQGPRAQLLAKVAPELARTLARFAGQRVGLFVCGRRGVTEQETIDAWAVIANILGPDTASGITGARWNEVPTNLNFTGGCGAAKGLGQGIMVSISNGASKRTNEAASVLSDGLTKALPPSPDKMPSIVDADFWQGTLREMKNLGLEDLPAVTMMINDPDLIVVTIGEHP